ncbi:hypothetical protein LXA43DRAFT_1028102 [Ganoderma leucocontextum]|nr:hypothetical protein LXA43DRAFT_1028102 [Ganoderma leucocontextum]
MGIPRPPLPSREPAYIPAMPVYYPTPQQYLIPLYYTTPPASIYHPYHRWSAGIQHPQAVAQAQAPVVVYATSRPPAQTYAPSYTSGPPVQTYQPPYPQRRGLLVGTSNPPTWNNVPSQNHILYSTSTVPRPGVAYNTKYIPSLNWPNLGPHAPQGLQPGVPTTQGARRRVRIAFHLRKRIPRKEGVPLSFLLHEDVSALKSLLEKPYEHVLPHGDGNWKTASSIALRFWVSYAASICGDVFKARKRESAYLPLDRDTRAPGSRPSIRTPCGSTLCPSTLGATT